MLPKRGWWGIEKGIQGDLVLKCKNPSFNINVSYDFPAAGNDHCRAVSSEKKYAQYSIYDNGKYGRDNPHNLILTIAVNPESEIEKKFSKLFIRIKNFISFSKVQ